MLLNGKNFGHGRGMECRGLSELHQEFINEIGHSSYRGVVKPVTNRVAF